MKDIITGQAFTGERALYGSVSKVFKDCSFFDGESPLKESKNLSLFNCSFGWKYPLWYCKNVKVTDCNWKKTGRSGVWYTNNMIVDNCLIEAPKQFRRCKNLTINNSKIPFAEETLWHCNKVNIINTEVTGDYFGMDTRNVVLENVKIDGNYCFDGGKNIKAVNCVFNSKDAFWNTENVTIIDSLIMGEYLSWNSKNITFINCRIQSHQGLCYIDNLRLKNCQVTNTDLAFELCSHIDGQITTEFESIKNPISGILKIKGVNQIIIDETIVDKSKTIIEIEK